MIYLDYNATTPIAPEVAQAMLPYLHQHFGNPSSSHALGKTAKQAVETARGQVAALLNCQPAEIVFTSGGTESNNYALRGAALARQDRGRHIITSAVEHPAVTAVFKWLHTQGFETSTLPVDSSGRVNPKDLEKTIRADTILVSVMQANNEVGTLQPIEALAEITRGYGALFHTDAAQSVGKIATNVQALGVDFLSVAGHKIYAPKGVGALYLRDGIQIPNLMLGARHENGRRPGTENVLQIVGLGQACEIARRDADELQSHFQAMRDRLQAGFLTRFGPDVRVNGNLDFRLPNTLSLCFQGVAANEVVSQVGDRVAISAGSACHADQVSVSAVLQAMQIPLEWAIGTMRLSVGRQTTVQEIDEAVEIVSRTI